MVPTVPPRTGSSSSAGCKTCATTKWIAVAQVGHPALLLWIDKASWWAPLSSSASVPGCATTTGRSSSATPVPRATTKRNTHLPELAPLLTLSLPRCSLSLSSSSPRSPSRLRRSPADSGQLWRCPAHPWTPLVMLLFFHRVDSLFPASCSRLLRSNSARVSVGVRDWSPAASSLLLRSSPPPGGAPRRPLHYHLTASPGIRLLPRRPRLPHRPPPCDGGDLATPQPRRWRCSALATTRQGEPHLPPPLVLCCLLLWSWPSGDGSWMCGLTTMVDLVFMMLWLHS